MNKTRKWPTPAASQLPARANLEHLKNEAKQHLKVSRAQTRTARLADAQLAIARSYGYSSWRKLKAYVDAMNSTGARLVEAVRTGNLDTIRVILDRYPELVNASTDLDPPARPSDAHAMRLIHLAIAEAKEDVLRLLIERGADLNVRNLHGRLALHDCFELNHDDFAKTLLGAGAEADVCAAAVYGMFDRLEQILTSDPTAANDLTTGESPLGWSIFGRQAQSAKILFRHGAIVDRPPYDTCIWRPASMVASTVVTPVLLECGANPNWRDENGNTPLHRVIQSRLISDPTEFIQLLLKCGADPALRNREGRTPHEEALLQAGKIAETYYPARPTGPKKLEGTIEILRSWPARRT